MSRWIDRSAFWAIVAALGSLHGIDGLLAVLGLAATLFLFGWVAYAVLRGLAVFVR